MPFVVIDSIGDEDFNTESFTNVSDQGSGVNLYNFGDEMVEKNTGGHKPVISRSDIGPVVLIERAVEAVLAPILSRKSPARRNQKQ